MDQINYCINVLWIHGASIGDIWNAVGAKSGKTKAAIRGIVDRAFDTPRADMSRGDRQAILNGFRAQRLDDGILDVSHFIARPLAAKAKPKVMAPLERKPLAKKKPLSRREQRKAQIGERRAKEIRELGLAPRGTSASPLEFLYERGLLAEPDEKKSGKVGAATVGNSLRRYQAGERLRSILVSAYSSGLKTQNYESVGGGGGGAGVVIHAAVVEALDNANRIRGMVFDEEFRMIDQMLREDRFVFDVPAAKAKDLVLEDVRRVLDVVSVFFEMMSPDDFEKRWNFKPSLSKPADRQSARRRGRKARDAILAAQRKVG